MIELPTLRNLTCRMCAVGTATTYAPKSRCVMPNDTPKVGVMLVGSEPTPVDDTRATPFNERYAMSLLDRAEKWGLGVYATFGVKCGWGQKTAIPAAAINTCRSLYMVEELRRVAPRHIIIFGATAWRAVTGKSTGFKQAESQRTWFAPLDAYLYVTQTLKTASFKIETRQKIDADMDNFERWILDENSHTSFNPRVEIVENIAQFRTMVAALSEHEVVACDTETTGLDYFDPTMTIRTIQFCAGPDLPSYVLPMNIGAGCYYGHLQTMTQPKGTGAPRILSYTEAQAITMEEEFHAACPNGYRIPSRQWSTAEWSEILNTLFTLFREKYFVWFNGKFDRLFLKSFGRHEFNKPIEAPNIYCDVMHLAFLLDENRDLGLKRLITTELGIPTHNISDKVTSDLDQLFPYAGADTTATYLLALHFREQMDEEPGLWRLYTKLMRRADATYTEIEDRGWPVSEADALSAKETLEIESIEYEQTMRSYLKTHGIEDEYNFAAAQQMGPLIFERLGLPMHPDQTIARTPTGGLSVDEDALYHLVEADHPFVKALLKWRGVQKALSTYVLPMLHAAQTRGRLTTTYKLTGTVTGRTASGKEGKGSSGMNLQNLPRDWGIPKIVRTKPGWVLISADLSQIELRIAAELSKDALLLECYREGKDVHTMRAMRLLGVDEAGWAELDVWVRDDARTKAKPVNFGFLYGMSARKFLQYALVQYGVRFSTAEATKIRAQFFSDHEGLDPWYARQHRQAERLGHVISLSGRIRRLPNARLAEGSSRIVNTSRQDALRQAVNSPVQGFGSDLKQMALIEIDAALDHEVAYVIGEIHDSIIVEVREEFAEEVAKYMVKVMRSPKILKDLGIELQVPLDADAQVGPSLYKKEMRKVSG